VAAQMPRLLFTGLEDYKIRGSQASPYLVVTHYDELAESKDIVLVRGDIILPNHLKDAEVRLNP
jgi:ATP synthase F1 complex assembly factor 1